MEGAKGRVTEERKEGRKVDETTRKMEKDGKEERNRRKERG